MSLHQVERSFGGRGKEIYIKLGPAIETGHQVILHSYQGENGEAQGEMVEIRADGQLMVADFSGAVYWNTRYMELGEVNTTPLRTHLRWVDDPQKRRPLFPFLHFRTK